MKNHFNSNPISTRNPSISTISTKCKHAPAVMIRHGLPSPPPTLRSDSNTIHPQTIQSPSLRSYLSNSTHNQITISSSHSSPNLYSNLYSNHSSSIPNHRRPTCTNASLKMIKNQLSKAQLDSSVYPTPQLPTSSISHQYSNRSSSNIRKLEKKNSSPPSGSTSNQSRTSNGLMSTTSSQIQFIPSSQSQGLTSYQDTSKLSTSALSNATLKPKTSQNPSEISSVDLRVSKLHFKDRSKDSSLASSNEHPHSRSKKLTTMKERNDRIFASINASLNPQPISSSKQSGSSKSPPGSLVSHPITELDSHLKIPLRPGSQSGLIPFAQDCSPNPRKISPIEAHPIKDMKDPSFLTTPTVESDASDDDQFGSVRHKRPERLRRLKPILSSDSISNSTQYKPHASQRDSNSSHEDEVEPKHPSTDSLGTLSDNTDESYSLTDCREWSETISMHTSSSDTIDAHDRSRLVRNSSRSSVSSSRSNSNPIVANDSSHTDQNGSSHYQVEKEECMVTPVKSRRSNSFQKTLRHANSVSDMLTRNNCRDEASVPWTPRATTFVSHRRSSQEQHHKILSPTAENSSSTDHSTKFNSNSILASPKGIHRSPQSHISLSHRQRPGLPEHFVQPHQTSLADSELHSTAETRRSVLQSSPSPRSDRTRRNLLSRLPQQPNSDGRLDRHSDHFLPGLDRVNGVESALSRYDGHHSFNDRTKYSSHRNKHSSWSVLEEFGKDLSRSQSVLGSAHDPRTTKSRRVPIRPRTSHIPLTRGYSTERPIFLEDDDDDQTSTTTYTNIHSTPRKTGSSQSRSRMSDRGIEDQEQRNRTLHSGSRLEYYTNSLHMSPPRRKSILEKDRTLRGNGGVGVPSIKPFTQLLRNTQQEKNSPNHNTDTLSSSSGTTSSTRLQSQRSIKHGLSPSTNVNRHSRPPTRSTSLAAIGLTALLSPTPTVDHHNLLISAYEALDRPQEEISKEARDLQLVLNGLLSSVVKNSCKIDATLTKLNESSLNHQVEMELADDYIDDEREVKSQTQQASSERITRQKYYMMKDSIAHMTKVQGQLVRTSNDQIRDLTEVLIFLSKLQRTQKESNGSRLTPVVSTRVFGSDNPRDSYGTIENNPKDSIRSGSRAGTGYSRSHSPSKLRHTIDLSPLSVISSHDGSPLSRTNSNSNDRSSHDDAAHSQGLSESKTSSLLQHNRAATISFAHERYLSIDGLPSKLLRAQKRASALSYNSIDQMRRDAPLNPQRSESQSSITIDEFGLYRKSTEQTLRSPVEFKYPNHDASWSRTESARNTAPGSQHSTTFPKTPPRVATSSLSHATAHSHVSPTRPYRASIESRSQRLERDPSRTRPQSSMSTVLDRAHHALSRTGHHPTVSAVPVGRKENGYFFERYSKPTSSDNFKVSGRRGENNEFVSSTDARPGGRKDHEEQSRSTSTASAALEKLKFTRGGARDNIHRHQRHHHEEEVRKLSGSTSLTHSHLPSSSSTSTSNNSRDSEIDDYFELKKDFTNKNHPSDASQSQRSRKASIQKLFGGLKRHNSQIKG